MTIAQVAVRDTAHGSACMEARGSKCWNRRSTPTQRATDAASSSPFGFTAPRRYRFIGPATKATPNGSQRDRRPAMASTNAKARNADPTRALAMRMP